ncbi:hypothetical protein [Oryza sativa Japonica Group]|uniref:Uncharacterized protein n=1 Tax=Oryza sativa subsp. japonica TaxID=39947 RepID=Q5VQP4_ORYSJ|nr:hypothetical protein [Oryza sativa Japonica Group]
MVRTETMLREEQMSSAIGIPCLVRLGYHVRRRDIYNGLHKVRVQALVFDKDIGRKEGDQ